MTLTCSECEQSVLARGYCSKHYQRWRRYDDPLVNLGRKYSFNENYFDSISTSEQAYWLGFIAADGGVSKYRLTINLKQQDSDHLLKFANCIESDSSVRATTCTVNGKIYHGARIDINSKHMVESLAHLGITPRKSLTLKPWNGPPDLMSAYWRGIFDGDGCICRRKDGSGFSWVLSMVGSHDCVNGFAQWGRYICGSVAVVHKKARIWEWIVGGNAMPRLLAEALYIPGEIALERKRILADTLCGRR